MQQNVIAHAIEWRPRRQQCVEARHRSSNRLGERLPSRLQVRWGHGDADPLDGIQGEFAAERRTHVSDAVIERRNFNARH